PAPAVPIPDVIIATAPRTTLASAATLYLAFISSSHWLAVGMVPHCDPDHAPRGSIPIRSVKSGPVVWVPRYPQRGLLTLAVSRFAAPQRTNWMCQGTCCS